MNKKDKIALWKEVCDIAKAALENERKGYVGYHGPEVDAAYAVIFGELQDHLAVLRANAASEVWKLNT